ncbi:sigma-70 family RNA polymerase sigma factor [uncultured Algoriphagus sp.]|mgnify:FL=1|uniref:RNA polymerase sigma factor n=1 Tax=uncultured Algoriphagus sp. TaxID=417365 RepID=UPI002583E0B3|nr:sigma-70 family RNA polymerase sigma factor [uncultured Algoriphagus sp.]
MKLEKNLSDQEITEMIQRNSNPNKAIAQLYEQHYDMLESMVIQNSGTEEEAADIIQESMLVMVQMIKSGKFRGESTIKSMLYSISKNKWISEIRRKRSSLARHGNYLTKHEENELDVSEAITRQENLNFVMTLFDKLGETCKKILKLFYYEDMAMKEICEKMEFSSEQVLRNKKYKCLKSLIESVKSSPQIGEQLLKSLRNEK